MRPKRLPEAVRQVVAVQIHLGDRAQVPGQHGIAQPRFRVGVQAPDGQVLGHALEEPERRLKFQRIELAGQAPGDHVVLKGVHHLVGEHVLEIGVRTGKRQDDPPLGEFGDAAGPLGDEAGQGVGLLELAVRRVEDDRLPLLELVAEDTAQADVRALRHARCIEGRLPFSGIVVDVEVGRLQDLEVEHLILQLVAPELGAHRLRQHGQ